MGQHTLKPTVAVIFNPSKSVDWDDAKKIVSSLARDMGYAEPLWIPTSEEDPGTGQTREAMAQKVDLVIAAGGDGTVRLVAGELAHTKVRLGILPMGTGNLFARNMGIPLDSVKDAATVAFGTTEERVDVGWVELASTGDSRTAADHHRSPSRPHPRTLSCLRSHTASRSHLSPQLPPAPSRPHTHILPSHVRTASHLKQHGAFQSNQRAAATHSRLSPLHVGATSAHLHPRLQQRLYLRRAQPHGSGEASRHPFLVVGGVGFDAETMASTDATLKKMIGVWAYFQAAIPNLLSRKFSATISAPNLSRSVTTAVRSVMFVNCPQLNSGIVLDPNADPADGALNLNVLDIHGGLIGWADLLRRVGMSWIGLRSRTKGVPYKKGVGGIHTHPIQECTVELERMRKVQVDGDVIGSAQILNVSVAPRAVRVRVPQK
ncbi:MAG: diacylglycerol kinase family protein [Actinomycetaceae bacterium]|nr:diacylglycerol kinase family protein [Actinomycetaceae bacterium]MDY5854008.1 diacylglycerol kinase family protein [Arcanobacterium sp.]